MVDAPLRVLFLTPYFRPYLGGIERAIEELSHEIQKSPQVEAVGVLTTKYSFPRVAEPDWADRQTMPDGIMVYRLPGFPRRSLPIYSVPLVWFPPGRVRQYLREFRPNVVHFVGDGWFWGHFWSWFFYRKRARFIFTPVLPHAARGPVVAAAHQRLHLQRRRPRGRAYRAGIQGGGTGLSDAEP